MTWKNTLASLPICLTILGATWILSEKFENLNGKFDNLDMRLARVEDTLKTLDDRVFKYRCTCGNPEL